MKVKIRMEKIIKNIFVNRKDDDCTGMMRQGSAIKLMTSDIRTTRAVWHGMTRQSVSSGRMCRGSIKTE